MLHNLIVKLGLLVLLTSLVGCGTQSSSLPDSSVPTVPPPSPTTTLQAPTTPSKPLVIGDISDKPAKKVAQIQPLADYLATHLTDFGTGIGEVKIAPDMQTMVHWLQSGEVDLYFDSPYPAMVISDQSGAQPILRRWKDGVADYHAVIFTRTDSGLSSMSDLKGQMVGFEDSFSTSGYLLPAATLLETGLKPVEQKGRMLLCPKMRLAISLLAMIKIQSSGC